MLHDTWDLPGSGIELTCPALARGFFPSEPPEKPLIYFLKLLPTSIEMLSDFHLTPVVLLALFHNGQVLL